MDGSFVESEIDLGLGGGESSPPPASGNQPPPQADRSAPSASVAAGTDGQQETPPATDEGQRQSGQPLSDEEISKLDLSKSEGLTEFRSAYEKRKYERDEAVRERDAFKQELETTRSSQGRGVYLSTDVPFEDFKPAEGLAKMATEEPEYHDALVDTVMEAQFWPEIAGRIKALEGQPLDLNTDEGRFQFEQLNQVWDFMSKRVAGTDGETMYNIINVVAKSPDIMQAIYSRINGGTSAMPLNQQPPQQGPQGVETPQQIAQRLQLDLSDPVHVRTIDGIRDEQQRALLQQSRIQQELDTRRRETEALRKEIENLRGGQEKIQGQSAEEAERRAESRVEQYLADALDKDLKETYQSSVPKDRPGLADRLKTLTKERLASDPNFQTAKATAKKWLKQAATASTIENRQKYEQRGLDAMAVISTLRANAMAEEAKELFGPIVAKAREAKQKSDNTRKRVEIPGGSNPPSGAPKPAQTQPGDIEGTRAAVRARLKQAGLGLPG